MSQTTHVAAPVRVGGRRLSMRAALVAAVAAGVCAGFFATGAVVAERAAADAGAELTRLLRAMALIKMLLVAGAVWLVEWRLRFPIAPPRAAGYLAATGVMAAGPGLIWGMAHVALGAGLLHGAGAVLLAMLWRDPGSPAMVLGGAGGAGAARGFSPGRRRERPVRRR